MFSNELTNCSCNKRRSLVCFFLLSLRHNVRRARQPEKHIKHAWHIVCVNQFYAEEILNLSHWASSSSFGEMRRDDVLARGKFEKQSNRNIKAQIASNGDLRDFRITRIKRLRTIHWCSSRQGKEFGKAQRETSETLWIDEIAERPRPHSRLGFHSISHSSSSTKRLQCGNVSIDVVFRVITSRFQCGKPWRKTIVLRVSANCERRKKSKLSSPSEVLTRRIKKENLRALLFSLCCCGFLSCCLPAWLSL